jgi:RimJ/RimL family protein N-acetyltransferase
MAFDVFPQTVTLKDGRAVTLAVLGPGDADALLTFYRALPYEDRQVLKDDVTTAGWAERFLAKVKTQEVISVIAKAGAKVVGEASLYRALHGWQRHLGEIRLTVAADVRRQGLGLVLAGALVKLATDLGIEKIIVQVVESQVGARRIFERLSFHHEAVLPRHVMDVSGIKRDLFVLANDVSQIWAAMEALTADLPRHQCEE